MIVRLNNKTENFISKTLVTNYKDGKVVREALRINMGAWFNEEWLYLRITNHIRQDYCEVAYSFKDVNFNVINSLIDIFDRDTLASVKNEINNLIKG